MAEISKDKIDKYDKIFNAICIKGMIEWDLIGFKVKYPSLYKCIIQSMDIVENQISPKRNSDITTSESNEQDYRIIDNANII